ncbi:type II secretion system minor pseudopilin GspJ [Pseudomonas sp. R5(2019)]|uniref:type II secretion system minor pseudopilin GspJ n=1 Tax=Pseudomonas sp. R5(2019) TaxID=2697566 RepID=UPI0014126097|nr:type II secretion system minor pseudopilin GspJ [Pseudomonas sp. R5(2019)]NBA96198.1 type II secretion system minor pseudopilin GspJ [Pseudomonas sp. R5(2019)]
MNQRGFTLLELLIAMALFSLLGLAGYHLLERTMGLEQHITRQEQHLRQLQRALSLFERDLLHALPHALIDEPSGRQALIGQPTRLRLMRGGWNNPLDQPRGDRLQVSHQWSSGLWLRTYYNPAKPDQPALEQHLLEGITLKRLQYIDQRGQRHPAWPIGATPLSLPQAIELELDAPGFPAIRRVILLPGSDPRGGTGDD